MWNLLYSACLYSAALCLLAPSPLLAQATLNNPTSSSGDVPGDVKQVSNQPSNAAFYLGINLNGQPVTIDGNLWEGGDSPRLKSNAQAFDNQKVPLIPKTDRQRSEMLRSSRWGRELKMSVLDLPNDQYQLFLYVWEDNSATTYTLKINGVVVQEKFVSGGAGTWRKLGPWGVHVNRGEITIEAQGGDANLSGIEIWKGSGELPAANSSWGERKFKEEDFAFFEKRIRPLLIEHCYSCHSLESDSVEGGLLLDSLQGLVRGGDNGAVIVPGEIEASRLIDAVTYVDPDLKMPPDGKLSDEEIGDLKRWVEIGAPDTRREETVTKFAAKHSIDWEKARQFWSFQPLNSSVDQTEIPQDLANWGRNPIDRYVLEGMLKAGLRPAADADRRVLIRRLTYDLTGLPPTPEEIDQFLNDNSPEAYSVLVERLLDSSAYGERWGRYWLDVVRYSDTAGDNSDFPIPQMIKYRDWVIEAFNRDLPYDQFIQEQIAGDLLESDDESQRENRIIATGYLANARRFGSRVDDYPQHLTIEDTIDNLGRTFLGLSLGCARCHDHKFDPITQKDYYALYGFFHSTRYPWPGIELDQKQRDLVPLTSSANVERHLQERNAAREELLAKKKSNKEALDAASKTEQSQEELKRLEEEKKSIDEELDKLDKQAFPFEQAYAVADSGKGEDSFVHIKGDPTKQGEKVPRRFLEVFGGRRLESGAKYSGRKELAQWLSDSSNPLVYRVMANRVWLHHFGRGLVATPNDFGKQGNKPSHPALLDWLADSLIQNKGSIKSLHRMIVHSRTYRMASEHPVQSARDSVQEIDPTNIWLSHFPRRRLDAEAIRDTLLTLSGKLNRDIPGPHPFPPSETWKFTQHNPFKAVYESDHRSVYLMTQRIQRHPYLAIFDGADPSASTAVRGTSTTPLQALYFLNDPLVHQSCDSFADRIIRRFPMESALLDLDNNAESQVSNELDAIDRSRLTRAYREALGREPTEEEIVDSQTFLREIRARLISSEKVEGWSEQVDRKAWSAMARVLLRLNEFVYID